MSARVDSIVKVTFWACDWRLVTVLSRMVTGGEGRMMTEVNLRLQKYGNGRIEDRLCK